MNVKISDALIIGWDYKVEKDNAVLIVGRQKVRGVADIINAFQGEEAKELYEKLTTRKEN